MSKTTLWTKDIQDIAEILKRYFLIDSDDIFDNHYDLLDEPDLEKIAARVIGRKISYILGDSSNLKQLVILILEQNTHDPSSSRIARIMVQVTEQMEEEATQLLKEMLIGLQEAPPQ